MVADLDVAVWPDGVGHGSGILAELTGTQNGNILQAQGPINVYSAGARQAQQQQHPLLPRQSRHMKGFLSVSCLKHSNLELSVTSAV